MSFSTKLNSFAHEIANIINAVLCLVRYSLFASTFHPAKRCSSVSLCWLHSLHLLHLTSPLEPLMILFQPFVPAKLDFFSAIHYSFHPVFEISHFAFVSRGILLSISPQRVSLTLPLLLSMLVSSLFEFFLHPVRCPLQNVSPYPLHALMR